jgi:hypothetical protein
MKPQQSEVAGSKLPNLGLSACVLGLVLCPFAYIAIGALTGCAPAFSFLALPHCSRASAISFIDIY